MSRNSSLELLGPCIRSRAEALKMLKDGGILREFYDPLLPDNRKFEYEILMPDGTERRVAKAVVASLSKHGNIVDHKGLAKSDWFHTKSWRIAE